MGSCDNWLFGKESEIEKLGDICKGVGELMKTKYNSGDSLNFRDWTGISEFLICYSELHRTLYGQKIHLYRPSEIREEWDGCCLDKGEAAILWAEIEWSHEIPVEVWSYMLQEGKRLGIQQLVEKTIREWGVEDDLIFNLIETELGKVQYPSPPF